MELAATQVTVLDLGMGLELELELVPELGLAVALGPLRTTHTIMPANAGAIGRWPSSVSYTHLTLPTNREV